MAGWTNLVFRIVLPPTLALTDGSTLGETLTFEIASSIEPWYCSIDQVKLEGGAYIRNLSDITIAAMIYQAGRDCDTISYSQPNIGADVNPVVDDLIHQQVTRFQIARQRYTQLLAARNLILNMWDINMNRGTKTLANFSVSKASQTKDEDVPKKLSQMASDLKEWDIVVRSAGRIGRGGRVSPGGAAKGIYGDFDAPAGRTWMTTGMGANRKSVPGFGAAGKPLKFGSPSVIQFRVGKYLGGHLSIVPKLLYGAY